VLTVAAWGIFACTLILGILAIAFGKIILNAFGPGFDAAYPALVVLVFGQIVNALAGSVGFLMIMTGHQRQMAYILCGVAVMNAALNAAFVPMYGLMGAAAATTMTHIVWNGIVLAYVLRVQALNPTVFPFRVKAGASDETP